jgi:hypothetical protein
MRCDVAGNKMECGKYLVDELQDSFEFLQTLSERKLKNI